MDRVERRLDATLKIVQTGMKMLVKMEGENREFRKDTRAALHALIESQMRTDAIVAALAKKIDRLVGRNGSNGSSGPQGGGKPQ